jgi:MFS family permease
MPAATTAPQVTRRLVPTLYAYTFLDDFVLLYPLYALLFARTGLSTGQISSLFVLWSLTTLTLEVPAGAWADAVSRRLLLCLAPLLGALGFGLWVVAPSYPAFAAGFVLWGAKSALMSGALEALVYEELVQDGVEDRFATVWGRAQALGVVAVLLAIVLASPVVAVGGYGAVGAASVAAGVAGALVAFTFPERRRNARDREEDEDHEDDPGYLATIRSGWTLLRADRGVRRAVLLVPAITSIFMALEEYTPLLASAGGASETQVPWWEAVVWGGLTVGGLVAGWFSGLGYSGLAVLVASAALVLAAGAATGRASGLVLVAVSFGLLQIGSVLAQARLQESMTGGARATVTSLASLGDELGALPVYLAYGWLADAGGDGLAFAVLAVPYLVVAAWIARPDGSPLRGVRRVTPWTS